MALERESQACQYMKNFLEIPKILKLTQEELENLERFLYCEIDSYSLLRLLSFHGCNFQAVANLHSAIRNRSLL